MKKSTIIFLKNTNKILKKNFFFKKNAVYLIAFSGGQDSMCLLIVFLILKKQLNLKIHILFCNHLWQKDTFFVFYHIIKVCFFLNLQISQSISNSFLLNENLSRFWRLNIFSKFLFFFNCSAILTGHSLNDQNETFFFNLFRGSGFFGIFSLQKEKIFTLGLLPHQKNAQNFFFFTKNTFFYFFLTKRKLSNHKGSAFNPKVQQPEQPFFYKLRQHKIKKKLYILEKKIFWVPEPLVKAHKFCKNLKGSVVKKQLHRSSNSFFLFRPLLFKTRNELKIFLIKLNLPVFPDKTNKKIFLSRNRIRKQIIPIIRLFFNKQINFTINKYIYIFFQKEKENYIFIKKFYNKIFYENKNFYFLNFIVLNKLPSILQKNIILFFFKNKLRKKFNFINLNYFFFFIKNLSLADEPLVRATESGKIKIKKIQIISPMGIFFFHSNFIFFIK